MSVKNATANAKRPVSTSEQADPEQQLRDALREPFHPDEVKWKPQSAKGSRAMAVAYVDARAVMDRLDDVLGIGGWSDSYDVLPDGAVRCRLTIYLALADGTRHPVTKEDVGGESEQPDEHDKRKAAFSSALKRAAVKLGIGRYLYHLPRQWVDYDPVKRILLRKPTLPDWAMPGAKTPPPPPPETPPAPDDQHADGAASPPPQPAAALAARAGPSLLDRLHAFDRKLTDEGLCKAGALILHVTHAMRGAGCQGDPASWDEAGWKQAGRAAGEFERERLCDLADRLFERKGQRFEQALAMLKLPHSTAASALDAAQWRKVVAALREYPDRDVDPKAPKAARASSN